MYALLDRPEEIPKTDEFDLKRNALLNSIVNASDYTTLIFYVLIAVQKVN